MTDTQATGFRDSSTLINKKTGDRQWVYPKKPAGNLYRGRTWFSVLLMLLLFSGPFLKINGHPALLLNIPERRFIIFGIPFWPQDLPLFALLMLTFLVFIIVFTVLFGRVWCGWACPQTVFMEMLFRKIEYWIEGDFRAQKKLDEAPWDTRKALKKTLKHTLFFILSFLIANTFLSYIIGIDELKKLVIEGPAAHSGQLISLLLFTAVFYLVFAKFREIVCIVVCPYGRLQGLMLDRNSIVVAYDFIRGEPRGLRRKNKVQELGDCVDCKRCVQVCPTGIDIRNGTQLECINCTACIDECNDVMQKLNMPTGLIRYASQARITGTSKNRLTLRSGAYVGILILLVSLLAYLLMTRKEVSSTILRTPGMLYQQQPGGHISNLYNFEVVNKTFDIQKVEIRVLSPASATLKMVDTESAGIILEDDRLAKGSFFIMLPGDSIRQNNTPVTLQVLANGKIMTTREIGFTGPVK